MITVILCLVMLPALLALIIAATGGIIGGTIEAIESGSQALGRALGNGVPDTEDESK